jgi:hypothetical protein
MSLPQCDGKREVTAGASYVFDCRTPPVMPGGGLKMQFLAWSVTGRVTIGGTEPPTFAAHVFGWPRTLRLRATRTGIRLGGK